MLGYHSLAIEGGCCLCHFTLPALFKLLRSSAPPLFATICFQNSVRQCQNYLLPHPLQLIIHSHSVITPYITFAFGSETELLVVSDQPLLYDVGENMLLMFLRSCNKISSDSVVLLPHYFCAAVIRSVQIQ
jgi:hypothetical protein